MESVFIWIAATVLSGIIGTVTVYINLREKILILKERQQQLQAAVESLKNDHDTIDQKIDNHFKETNEKLTKLLIDFSTIKNNLKNQTK